MQRLMVDASEGCVRRNENVGITKRSFGDDKAIVPFFLGKQSFRAEFVADNLYNAVSHGQQIERLKTPRQQRLKGDGGQLPFLGGLAVTEQVSQFLKHRRRNDKAWLRTLQAKGFKAIPSALILARQIEQDVGINGDERRFSLCCSHRSESWLAPSTRRAVRQQGHCTAHDWRELSERLWWTLAQH